MQPEPKSGVSVPLANAEAEHKRDACATLERATRAAELLKSALERDPREWPSFLDEACGSDTDLRAEVESLLQFQQPARGFMQQPAIHLAADVFLDRELKPEETIGDYKIISLIGSGGMGDVYLAEDRQLRRQVALKIVRRGMNTDDVVRRFQREEQILASLNHPNIARLYGGAITADGVPFFIMEYVDGTRLDEYCDDKRLLLSERLTLFRKVCGAVAYAHQHLVIHRDLKPSNIRVTSEGEPKLLDFGIAKLLDPATSVGREPTMTFPSAMTPEYASPEQLRGETMTTTSDVYSLGIILYKILTGRSPYRTKTNRPDEIARAIADQDPERPSTAIVRGASFQLAEDRNLESRATNPKLLRGDLDNIVLRALCKEPERRYASVGQFSADIQRHLDGLPVIARKDTFQYRSAKFIKRHRLGVAAALLLLLSLIGGILASTRQARVAQREKIKAEEIKNFLERTLNYSNPHLMGKSIRETTVTEVLDEAAKRLETENFADQPEIKAELEQIIARSYSDQGKYDLGRKHLREFVDLQSKLPRQSKSKMLEALASRAGLLIDQGDLIESEKIHRQVLPLMREEKRKGNIKVEMLARTLNYFAFLRRMQGDSKEAESLFRESLALGPQMPSAELRAINGEIRSTLASTLADQGKFEEALQTARAAVEEYRQRGEIDSGNFGFAMTILGGFLIEKGAFEEADANLREAESIFRKFFISSNLWLGDALRNQAASFYAQGRYVESLKKVTETINIYLKNFGAHYDNYPTALIIKGLALAKTGQLEEGEAILREAVKIRTESLPKEHYWVAQANSALGECLTIEKRYQEAEPLLIDSYESLKKSQGAHNPRTTIPLQRLVVLYETWGRIDTASEYRSKLSSR